MSDNLQILIPTDENFIPSKSAQLEGLNLLQKWQLSSEDIRIELNESIKFYDAGENFHEITCPLDQQKIEISWWQDAMSEAYKTGFEDLKVTLPCCQSVVSLNDLIYDWLSGFAKFAFLINNPKRDLSAHELNLLIDVLGCELKKVFSRY